MSSFKDRTGMRYGRWLVLGFDKVRVTAGGNKFMYWHCRCDCGTERSIAGMSLHSGQSKSCGCLVHEPSNRRLDLTGEVYGRLTVESFDHIHKYNSFWNCICSCGNRVIVTTRSLRTGKVSSCGCLYLENLSKISKEYVFEGTNIASIRSNKPNSNNKSGVRGVYFNKNAKQWVGHITCKRKMYSKYFKTMEEAIAWRKAKEEELFAPLIEDFMAAQQEKADA